MTIMYLKVRTLALFKVLVSVVDFFFVIYMTYCLYILFFNLYCA